MKTEEYFKLKDQLAKLELELQNSLLTETNLLYNSLPDSKSYFTIINFKDLINRWDAEYYKVSNGVQEIIKILKKKTTFELQLRYLSEIVLDEKFNPIVRSHIQSLITKFNYEN